MLEGQLAVAEGRWDAAIALLEPVERHYRRRPDGDRWMIAVQRLADAWAAKGEMARAIALLEAPQRRLEYSIFPSNYSCDWLEARDRLSQLYRQSGRIAEADTVDAELRALLAVADEDHPIRRRLDQRGGAHRSGQ
jgi:hypothetical protein